MRSLRLLALLLGLLTCIWHLKTVCIATETELPGRPVSMINDVVPILTKTGCNAGTCHAKAGNGQNGFQLSLLGFEPLEDYQHLVLEGRGRRLSKAAPEQSLLLLKATGQVPQTVTEVAAL